MKEIKNKNDLIQLIKESRLYNKDKKAVIYRGNKNPKILFIGEAPGKDENKVGKPFVGRSGKLLQNWIDTFKLTKYYGIANTCPLIPLTKDEKIRKPSPKEISYFRPFVKYILKRTNPKIIICLGSSATESLLNKRIGEMIRENTIIEKGKYKILAMYHPSYFLRQGKDGIEEFKIVYKNIRNILKENINKK